MSPILDGADTTRARYAYDVAKAKELLTAAGHPNGIDIELWHSQDAVIARLAQTVQGYLNAAGIRTKLVQRDAASAREASRKGETDMTLKTWYADYPDADSFLYPLLYSGEQRPGRQRLVLRQPGVRQARRWQLGANRTIRSALRSTAPPTRSPTRTQPMVPLFFYNDLYAVQPWIRNFKVPTIFNGQRWTDVKIAGPEQRP